jgi:transposase
MTTTIDDLVPEQLWRAIQPLLPTPPPRYGGRPRVDDRACLAGIVYQLRTGVPWRLLPPASSAAAAPSPAGGGCGTGNAPTSGGGCIDCCLTNSAATVGSTGRGPVSTRLACAPSGGLPDRPEPDRPRQAREQVSPAGRPPRHPAGGVPVGGQHARLAAAGGRGGCGRAGQGGAWSSRPAAQAPVKLQLNKAYDYPRCRRALRRRGITPRIARRGVESSARLGRHRYVVERSLAWLVGHRRLQVRYERRADVLLGFLYLACALICLKSLNHAQA